MSRTKTKLLELFESNRGSFISGEKIAECLNISRTAVWKAVNSLRRDGYQISAVTNKGYCLAENSDIISAQGIQQYLSDICSNVKIEVFSETDSTNMVCRNKANDGEQESYVAVASRQTGGRGRNGRSFFSPADTGLYLSILIRPNEQPDSVSLGLTTMAAVAACEAIEKVSGKHCDIKWVNDVLLDNKKVCGILCEASYALEDQKLFAVVVGLGINVYPPKEGFPEEIKDIAGTVFDQSETGIRNQLAAEIINRFMAYYKHVTENGYQGEYIKRSIVPGKDIEVHAHGEVRPAHALAIDDTCGLMVRYEDGSAETLHFGEVSIKGLY
ncbi:MAG: biotin--[acetyl-CoA-carboxylase] ligase [Mogibacterium sp.]|nr:biotin--[acetyl-CoA-carboxylase] ligase [Mogibacterium sp.]